MEPITILIPSWKRRRFLPLLISNLKHQQYPHDLLTVIIDDDGIEKPEDQLIKDDKELHEIKEHLQPIKLQYNKSSTRKTIGKKRNELIKQCKTKIFAFMDTDDLYLPSYLTYSIDLLKSKKVGCVGSDQMLFCMTDKNFDINYIQCGGNIELIHEASIVATKKWYKSTCGFANNSAGEGKNLFQGVSKDTVAVSDIRQCMICIQHSGNTIDKLRFAKEENKLDFKMDPNIIKLLNVILDYKDE